MNYYTLTIEFLALKYYTNFLFYQFFLPHLDFFFSLISSVASYFFFFSPSHSLILSIAVASFFSHKPNEIRKNKRKKKEKREKRERPVHEEKN